MNSYCQSKLIILIGYCVCFYPSLSLFPPHSASFPLIVFFLVYHLIVKYQRQVSEKRQLKTKSSNTWIRLNRFQQKANARTHKHTSGEQERRREQIRMRSTRDKNWQPIMEVKMVYYEWNVTDQPHLCDSLS